MKIKKIICAVILLSMFSTINFTCKKEIPADLPDVVNIQQTTDVSENSFKINWTTTLQNITKISIEIARDATFNNIEEVVVIPDHSATSHIIDGLNGATVYFVKIIIEINGESPIESNVKSVQTSHYHEPITATTVDGLKIAGSIHYLESNTSKNPGVLFMGVFSLSNHWGNEVVFLDLISRGYVCYKFNWRGHGGSDWWPLPITLDSLEVFVRKHAKNDMLACYTLLKNHEKVDSNRIALIGGSLGANETLNGNCWYGVKASVALTPSRLGLTAECPIKGAFFIACEDDKNSYANYANEAIWLHDNALDPKKLLIFQGDAHALDMLTIPTVNEEIINWVTTRMEDR